MSGYTETHNRSDCSTSTTKIWSVRITDHCCRQSEINPLFQFLIAAYWVLNIVIQSLFRCYLAIFLLWLQYEINYDEQRLRSDQRYGGHRDCSVRLDPLNTQVVHLSDVNSSRDPGYSDRRNSICFRSANPLKLSNDVNALRPTRHAVMLCWRRSSQSLCFVLKKLNLTQEKQTKW